MSSAKDIIPSSRQRESTNSQRLDSENDAFQMDDERRLYRRVRLEMKVRFLLLDGSEHGGEVLDISAGGIAIVTAVETKIGDTIVLYIDEMGGFEGTVKRHLESGFAIEFKMGDVKRDRTENELTWLINEKGQNLPDRRHHRRTKIKQNTILILAEGTRIPCRIFDLSNIGVAIEINERPSIGEIVLVGRTEGRVVRHFLQGVAIEFLHLARHQQNFTE